MYVTNQKEEFSVAYVHAVASVAGFALQRYDVDNDSADVAIRSDLNYSVVDCPRVELQLKCSASLRERDGALTFDLPSHNYNKLCSTKRHTPLFLVVVHIPKPVAHWMEQKHRTLAHLRNCAYWAELHGRPPTTNAKKTRIAIPCSQVFTPAVLASWIQRVGDGEFL